MKRSETRKGPFICLLVVMAGAALTGCANNFHAQQMGEETISKVTVGQIQKEIVVGMSGADVITLLGSPNIVTRDKKSKEVWVYDKLSTDFAFSNSGGEVSLMLLGIRSSPRQLWGAQGGGGLNSGATRLSQKTLTLIIKMSSKGTVEDFTYHASSF